MKQTNAIILGTILGGAIMYLIVDKETPNGANVVKYKNANCVKNEISMVSFLDKIQTKTKEENYVGSNIDKEKTQSRKTPDELYEEQQTQIEESEEAYAEKNIVDRDVMPIELTQAENEIESITMIDEIILPKALQEAEKATINSGIVVSDNDIDDIPSIEPIADEIISEDKPAISEEMKEVEEYPEENYLSNESEIPL